MTTDLYRPRKTHTFLHALIIIRAQSLALHIMEKKIRELSKPLDDHPDFLFTVHTHGKPAVTVKRKMPPGHRSTIKAGEARFTIKYDHVVSDQDKSLIKWERDAKKVLDKWLAGEFLKPAEPIEMPEPTAADHERWGAYLKEPVSDESKKEGENAMAIALANNEPIHLVDLIQSVKAEEGEEGLSVLNQMVSYFKYDGWEFSVEPDDDPHLGSWRTKDGPSNKAIFRISKDDCSLMNAGIYKDSFNIPLSIINVWLKEDFRAILNKPKQ